MSARAGSRRARRGSRQTWAPAEGFSGEAHTTGLTGDLLPRCLFWDLLASAGTRSSISVSVAGWSLSTQLTYEQRPPSSHFVFLLPGDRPQVVGHWTEPGF